MLVHAPVRGGGEQTAPAEGGLGERGARQRRAHRVWSTGGRGRAMATRRRPLRELSAEGLPNDANRTKIHGRSESEKGPSPNAAMGGDI